MFGITPWKKREGNELTRFKREMDSLFDRFFEGGFPSLGEFFSESNLYLKVDVIEGKSTITVKAEIPGVDSKDIDVSLDGRLLTIKGEKKQEKEEKEENYHRIERSYGSFNRTVELPAEVDSADVDASYKTGILTIELKKTKESEAKKIEIKTG